MRNDVLQVRIDSQFSRPTDLATQMSNWSEFIRGDGYFVELESDDERVVIDLIPASKDDEQHVIVRGEGGGRLFLAALGLATYALSANSKEVWAMRWYA